MNREQFLALIKEWKKILEEATYPPYSREKAMTSVYAVRDAINEWIEVLEDE